LKGKGKEERREGGNGSLGSALYFLEKEGKEKRKRKKKKGEKKPKRPSSRPVTLS